MILGLLRRFIPRNDIFYMTRKIFTFCFTVFIACFFISSWAEAGNTRHNQHGSHHKKHKSTKSKKSSRHSKSGGVDTSLVPKDLDPKEPVIRVLVGGRRQGIKAMPLEMYLAGVIGNEMSRRWPVEALKAQAVAARSYALSRMEDSRKAGRAFDVVPNQGDQVFRLSDIKNDYLRSIVEQTHGQVLKKGGNVVTAYYSSTCGGKSRGAQDAGLARECPSSKKKDAYCKISPFRDWSIETSLHDLKKLLKKRGMDVDTLQSVEVASRDKSGYVKTIEFADEKNKWVLAGNSFRSMMGSMQLKSLLFHISQSNDGRVTIHGNGFGHGVGMCQYGAYEMANHRKNYKTILTKYYPGAKVEKIY